MGSDLKTEYLHIRITQKNKIMLKMLADLNHDTISSYINRLIPSIYYRIFDEGDHKNENSTSDFYDIL